MEIVLWVLFFLLILVALYGSFIAKFPSSLLVLAAVLIAKFGMAVGEGITWLNLSIIVALVIIAMIVTRYAPKLAKKISDYDKYGTWGTIVGSLLGLLLSVSFAQMESAAMAGVLVVLTMLIVPFIFALIFEFVKQKNFQTALSSAVAATVVYAFTAFIKLLTVVYAFKLVFTNN